MIILDLVCARQHRFEAWFASNDSFCAQLARGQVECPECGSHEVERLPSAVHIGRSDTRPVPPPNVPAAPLTVYQQFVSALLAASDDTGTDFAEEARRIHRQEAPARAIHGESSAEEFEALRDEGIEVWRLPVLGKNKLN